MTKRLPLPPDQPLTAEQREDYRQAAELLSNGLAKLMRLVPDWEADNDLAMVLLSAASMVEQLAEAADLTIWFPPLRQPDDLDPSLPPTSDLPN